MCIIVIKPKNKDIQKKEILQRCFNNNKDGAGYMFVNSERKVIIKKGFMKFDDFYKSVMKDYKENILKDKTLVMHFRIGTSGQNKLGCTHPFPITDKFDELETLRLKTNIGICHNGIIPNFNAYSNKRSDTELYISTVLTPLIRLNLQSYKFNDIQKLILETTNSKWAILDKFDEYYTIGRFYEDDGYLYSNETYKQIQYTFTTKYSDIEDDDDDLNAQSAWYKKAYEKQKQYDVFSKSPNSSVKNAMLPVKVQQRHIVDVSKYKELKIGNVVCATSVDNFYKNILSYFEIETNEEYYFDKDYNIYRLFRGANSVLKQIGRNAFIYTDAMLTKRRDFHD